MHHSYCLFWFLPLFHVWAVPVQFIVDMLQIVTVFYEVSTIALQVLVQYAQPLLALILLFGSV
jgi:hypothetical protein